MSDLREPLRLRDFRAADAPQVNRVALAAFNQFKGPKEMVVLPASDHHGNHGAQTPYGRSRVIQRNATTTPSGAAAPRKSLVRAARPRLA